VRVLFITIAGFHGAAEGGIYTDLLREFRDRGDDVYVVCPAERRHGGLTQMNIEDATAVLRVRTGNLTKVRSTLEKGLATLMVERQFVSAVRRFWPSVSFDLVLYTAPPVTFDRVINYMKRRDNCTSYLLLKDIFPQNAVDLGLMRNRGAIWRYFRCREKRLYAASDVIGCMSSANAAYVREHNPEVSPLKVEVCPNSIRPLPLRSVDDPAVRGALGIPRKSTLLVYGGNLGVPQGLDFLLDVVDRCRDRADLFFLIVGSGTEYSRMEAHLREGRHVNARLVGSLPRDRYRALLAECDIGLIFLDPRFTIPNFPSRLTEYMEAAIPVIAATDSVTDLPAVLEESHSGLGVRHGDIEGFLAAVESLSGDRALRRQMGDSGRAYLEEHYTVARAYETITAHLQPTGGGTK
jgi:glycosyltransferase involved in cell wall biosynthesis